MKTKLKIIINLNTLIYNDLLQMNCYNLSAQFSSIFPSNCYPCHHTCRVLNEQKKVLRKRKEHYSKENEDFIYYF